MDHDTKDNDHDAPPFRCYRCPKGRVYLRWRTLLLHFGREDVQQLLECLGAILEQPSASFCLGAGPFCACRAADGFCYLVCQDRVVLRLSSDEAQNLHGTLGSFNAEFGSYSEL